MDTKQVQAEVRTLKNERIQPIPQISKFPSMSADEKKDAEFKLDRLLDVALIEPTELPITPYAKNLYISKDTKTAEDRIPLDSPVLKWEQFVFDGAYNLGLKYYGKPVTDYEKVSPDQYAAVDYWRNFFKMGREVTPGSSTRRIKMLTDGYLSKSKSYKWTFRVDDKILKKAIEIVLNTFKNRSLIMRDDGPTAKGAFQEKNSNVGFRGYANERKKAADGRFYGQKAKDDAKHLLYPDIKNVHNTLIGRDQRAGFEIKMTPEGVRLMSPKDSKARVVFASSRTVNTLKSKIVVPGTDAAKSNNLFIGYLPPEEFQSKLTSIAKFVSNEPNLVVENLDFSSYDTTISPHLMVLAEFILKELFPQAQAKQLIHQSMTGSILKLIRYRVKRHSKGGLGDNSPIFGTIGSGDNFTNGPLGGVINALVNTYINLVLDRNYSLLVSKLMSKDIPHLCVMGDDVLAVRSSKVPVHAITIAAKEIFGMTIHPDKGEKGTFFLQNRISINSGEVRHSVPSSRIISKMCGVERPKELSATGGDLASGSKLGLIKDNPEVKDVILFFKEGDKSKLGTADPLTGKPRTLKQWYTAMKKEFTEHGNTPMDIIYDGDPGKSAQWNEDGFPASEYIQEMGDLVSSV